VSREILLLGVDAGESVVMSTAIVEPVVTRRQKKQFLQYPWRLYRGDPNWIPPLRRDQEEMVGYRPHPFYEKNQAQTFLAYRDGEVCGRIAAIANQAHVDAQGERRGFFGFFECIDDQEVANGLFDAARTWLAERDLPCMRGPMNPGINYTLGVLVEGFDSPPTFMMTYNPSYYDRLVEGYGFRKSQDLYAYMGTARDMLPVAEAKLFPLADLIEERFDVKIRMIDKSRFREDVEDFMNVYNVSMVDHWGFSPMSSAEIQHAAKSLCHLIVPELACAAEIDGKVVGAGFVIPDYNPRIKRIDGRLFPFGFIRLLWNKRSIKRVRNMATNVIPEYQMTGVLLVWAKAMALQGTAWGMEEIEYSWIAESNRSSRGSVEKAGTKRTKTYRVYDWDPV